MTTYTRGWITRELRRAEYICNYFAGKQSMTAINAYHFWMARRRWLISQLIRIQLRDFNTN